MSDIDNQQDYWDSVAEDKRFSLPFDMQRFASIAAIDQRILDYGCGYGRISGQLWEKGYRNITGVDPSPRMIERAKREHPDISFILLDQQELPFEDATFDAVILFAVLTCIPTDDGQRSLMDEISRVLRPGGILYLSDFLLQDDDRNRKRYEEFERVFGTYGVFQLPEGVVLRHHERRWIESLTSGFEVVDVSEISVSTMNGNPAKAIRYFGRKTE